MNRYERHLFPLVEQHALARQKRASIGAPFRLCEIGVWRGDHAVRMIKAALLYCPHVHYYGFDLFEDLHLLDRDEIGKSKPPLSQQQIREKIGGMAAVDLIKGDTRTTLEHAQLPEMDFIFLDGGHSLETIESDWRNLQRCIGPQTLVILDDYYANRTDAGCRPLVEAELAAVDCGYEFEVLPLPDEFDGPHGKLMVQMVSARRRA